MLRNTFKTIHWIVNKSIECPPTKEYRMPTNSKHGEPHHEGAQELGEILEHLHEKGKHCVDKKRMPFHSTKEKPI